MQLTASVEKFFCFQLMQNHITFTKPLSVLSLKLLSHFYLSRAITTNTPIQIWSDPPAQKKWRQCDSLPFRSFFLPLFSAVAAVSVSSSSRLAPSLPAPLPAARPSPHPMPFSSSPAAAAFLTLSIMRSGFAYAFPSPTHPHRCPVRLSALQGNSFLTASVHALIISLL